MHLKNIRLHGWLGKYIGLIIGYYFLGPLGSLAGLLIGNFIDKEWAQHSVQTYLSNYHQLRAETQKIFFEATFLIMGYIAKTDGHVSRQEISMAQTIMEEMQLNSQKKESAKQLFTLGKKNSFNLSQTLEQLLNHCKNNRELLKLFIDIQYRAAQADTLSELKIKALDNILIYLGFAPLHKQYQFYEDFLFSNRQNNSTHSQQQSNQYNTSASNSLAGAYAVLEVSPNASKQEVKKAYRLLISKNHPDKLIAKGLPESMIKIANDKTQQITKAYELICRTQGW